MRRRVMWMVLGAGLWLHASVRAHAPQGPGAVVSALRELAGLAREAAALPPSAQATFVNNAINRRVNYAEDEALCGAHDCWQTPAETLASGWGDCEDIAIAKYFLLRACREADDPARLLYAIHTADDTPGRHQAHLVMLADGAPQDPLVLDNLNLLTQPISRRPDLAPVFSFGVDGLWQGVGGRRVGEAAALLRPWRELLGRWAAQRQI